MSSAAFEFNGVVRFTKIGTTYLAATMVLAISAINTGNNALYIGVALMLGSLLLSGIASKGGLKHLHAEIGGMEEVWAGRPAHGTLRVRNESRIWNVRDVVITSEALAEPVLLAEVQRRGTVEVDAAFLFPRRGLAHVHSVDSYTRYPFGFFLKKRRLRVRSEVLVYPRVSTGEDVREQFRPAPGEESVANLPGPGSEIHSFREYARGDSLRHVHWKKSASLGRWIMKQTEAESSSSIHVLVDPYQPQGTPDDELEQMISSAATLIYHAVQRDLDVTLSLPSTTLRARQNQSASPLFRALALLEASPVPVHQFVERDTIVFSVMTSSGAKTGDLLGHERDSSLGTGITGDPASRRG
ncbi:MAG: DUF58 domain-containing protein [Acidobacteriota bacterium]